MTELFSAPVLAHVRANAPALASGVVDYDRLLTDYSGQVDFFDSREHLGSLPGSALAAKVRARAGALAARGVGPADRIVMVAANDERYLTTLLAVLLLGAVPCAVAPPTTPTRQDSAGVQHLRAAIRVVDPTLVLGPSAVAAALPAGGLLSYEELDAGVEPGRRPSETIPDRTGPTWLKPRPEDIHHIQLTSGSTAAPKAVLLTHANVAHNLGVLAHAVGADARYDRMFSWLPMYHDMGLVQVLGGLVYGAPVGLMSPLGFLRDPLSWMRHMTVHGSTVTAGPTFAYRAVTDALGRSSRSTGRIDLCALRHAFVGAEPVVAETLRRFTDSFAPLGLRSSVLVPCYGMAESVLATTLALQPAPEAPGNFGRVRAVGHDDGGAALVSCGRPIDGMRVSIVDPAGAPVAPGAVGDIRISGHSLMTGYREFDGTVSPPPHGWHDTGDRGFLRDGELFVVGRSKEMLIIRGRNMPPYDVERTIGDIPEVGPGQSVVFSVPDERRGRELVVAVVATSVTDPAAQRRLQQDIDGRVRQVFGFSIDEIVVVPRAAIPRTTSGKIQRLKVRESYRFGRSETSNETGRPERQELPLPAAGPLQQVLQPAHVEQHASEPTTQD
ncbi:MAG TPA: AMP-binding protein [Mycobacterium sp.]|nr:AMP-binding protein [Mycobacterium sp.]